MLAVAPERVAARRLRSWTIFLSFSIFQVGFEKVVLILLFLAGDLLIFFWLSLAIKTGNSFCLNLLRLERQVMI